MTFYATWASKLQRIKVSEILIDPESWRYKRDQSMNMVSVQQTLTFFSLSSDGQAADTLLIRQELSPHFVGIVFYMCKVYVDSRYRNKGVLTELYCSSIQEVKRTGTARHSIWQWWETTTKVIWKVWVWQFRERVCRLIYEFLKLTFVSHLHPNKCIWYLIF